MEHVWDWYSGLNAERGSNGFSINPIRSADVKAWGDARGIEITLFEIEMILAIDREYMRVHNG